MTSLSPGMGFGQRFAHSIASSFDFTCHSQKPATSSFVSVNGPSITVRFAAREADAGALGGGVEAFARQHDAGLHAAPR